MGVVILAAQDCGHSFLLPLFKPFPDDYGRRIVETTHSPTNMIIHFNNNTIYKGQVQILYVMDQFYRFKISNSFNNSQFYTIIFY